MDFTIPVLKIILENLEEKGLIEILDNLTDKDLTEVMNEVLNGSVAKVHAPGNLELQRQKEIEDNILKDDL
jgi:hypothetical protein